MSVSPLMRARHGLRTRVSEHPNVYLPFARRKYPGPSPEVISAETELVIDGYTRSATTFAVYALQLAQDRPVRLAHHLHAPAQLMEAARRDAPVLALIRAPDGAVLSQLVREPWVDMRDATRAYARFYESLLPYRSAFVVGEFQEVTNAFDRVVQRLNERYGLTLKAFDPTTADMSLCFELMKERPTLSKTLLGFESGVVTLAELQAERARPQAKPLTEVDRDLWVPSTKREDSKAKLREQWDGAAMRRLKARAQDAYHEFVKE